MRHYLAYFFALVMIPLAHAKPLNQSIDQLIQETLPHSNVGVVIVEADTGKTLYERNANKLFNPASNIKLLTAAAALYQLGQDYQFETTLAQHKNNIYLTFSGSPSFTVTQLKQLIQQLKESGVQEITGNLVIDSSRFKRPYYAPGTSYDDMGWYYAAPGSAIILNGNAAAFEVTSAKELGKPVQITAKTTDNPLTVVNEVITVDKEQEKNHCGLNIDIKRNNTLRLYGCLSQTEKPRVMQLAIPNPLLFAKRIIKSTLDENGIPLRGKIISGKTPTDATILKSHKSENMVQLVKHMLEESDNLYADSLTKSLAYALTKQGTYKQGIFAIKTILAQHTKLNMDQLEFADGIGTRYNLMTPQQITVLLSTIYHDETLNPVFFDALPQSGVSGSLKDRMKKTPLEKNVLAKTGTMHDISSLSGYLTTKTGKVLIFSIICNDVIGNINKAKQLQEHILLQATG